MHLSTQAEGSQGEWAVSEWLQVPGSIEESEAQAEMMRVDIRVNKDHIAHITAHRRDNYMGADVVSIYDWEAKYYKCPKGPEEGHNKMYDPGEPRVQSGIVHHAYKDGAPMLLLSILQELRRKTK